MTTLSELVERCLNEPPSRELDRAIQDLLLEPEDESGDVLLSMISPFYRMSKVYSAPMYTSSVDAAMGLMGERQWGVSWDNESVFDSSKPERVGYIMYSWVDHVTNTGSYLRSPSCDSFAEARQWLARLITANSLKMMAGSSISNNS